MTNEQLAKRDYVICVDKSGSMSEADCVGGKTRWVHMQEQVMNIARKCAEFDDDGIDVIVFGGTAKEYKGVTPDTLKKVFAENSPSGSTDTTGALKIALDGYFKRKSSGFAKPLTVIVFTDGQPDDKASLEHLIVSAANKIQADEEIGISFLQVGSNAEARAFLQKLDDGLTAKGAKFDIVDTKNDAEMENLSAMDILVQAVTD